jgi:thioredoxin 1
MASDRVNTFTDASFPQDVLASDIPVVVDFWAEWCAPCRAIAPLIDQLATQYEGKVIVGKVNIDQNQQIAQQYRIASIPTIMVFKGGKVINQVTGANPQKIQGLFAAATT